MDILIKSFNRPYYLDRCLQSIYQNVANSDFTIKILDDGTPDQYLQKLKDQYPQITIYKSELYELKSSMISQASSGISEAIPIDLWVEAAQNATDYFLLLEDDIWLTQPIDLQQTEVFLKSRFIFFLKLFWLGNPKLTNGFVTETTENVTTYEPSLFTRNPLLFRIVFKMTRFKIRKLMTFLNLYSTQRMLDYYSLYSVAGVVFKKEYFISLWKNNNNVVDEHLQIQNGLHFWKQHPHMKFARTNTEMAQTGFSSSATNKSYNKALDVFELNRILNDAWFKGDFDVMQNFPQDLDSENIKLILKEQSTLKIGAWEKWVLQFKNHFRAIGCKIE